jgi:hypothetical protein
MQTSLSVTEESITKEDEDSYLRRRVFTTERSRHAARLRSHWTLV